MTALLRFDAAGLVFDDGTCALDAIALDIDAGRTTAFLGASGCGKSSLLRLAAGLATPTQGAVRWDGPRPRLGFVFQQAALMPWASVADNVALPLAIAGGAHDKVMPVLERVGLADRARALPHELSGGMQMRASIARAMVARPDVLLLDEPFSALDEVTRQDLQQLVADLVANSGLTALLVTHSVSEAVFLADRIALMTPRPGRIAATTDLALPCPRDDGWRRHPAYQAACATLSAQLRATMAGERP